jgi:hypothetical protein
VHLLPSVPQLLISFEVATQLLLSAAAVYPGAQVIWQALFVQVPETTPVPDVVHWLPMVPQLLTSVVVATQLFLSAEAV